MAAVTYSFNFKPTSTTYLGAGGASTQTLVIAAGTYAFITATNWNTTDIVVNGKTISSANSLMSNMSFWVNAGDIVSIGGTSGGIAAAIFTG